MLDAVDLCYKAFYVLQAKYPVESEVVWNFLQTYVYEIPIRDKNFVSVDSVCSDLNNTRISDVDEHEVNSSDSESNRKTNVNDTMPL